MSTQILFGELALLILRGFVPRAPHCDSSLQVFESENHATIHSDQTKEGLSLFGPSYPSFVLHHSLFLVFRHIEHDPDCLGSLTASHMVYATIIITTDT